MRTGLVNASGVGEKFYRKMKDVCDLLQIDYRCRFIQINYIYNLLI